jgi:hypothetical protein
VGSVLLQRFGLPASSGGPMTLDIVAAEPEGPGAFWDGRRWR